MSKIKNMDQLDEQKEAIFNMIDDLRDYLDIDLENLDSESIKEWGKSLLVAGIGAFLIYKLINGIFGSKKVELEEDSVVLKDIKVKDDSVIARFVKEQAAIILLSMARKWIKKYLKAKNIVDED